MIGVGVIAGLTAATVLTGGTVGVICGFALAGSVIGGTVGAVSGYKSGGWSGAATGFMTGTISGAASGALAGSGAGYITQAICGGLINATSGVVKSTENMKKVQVKPLAVDFAGDFAVGAISGLIGGRGILNKKESLSAAMNTFDRIAAREIRRKNAIYSAKIIKSAMYDYQHAWIKNGIISGARYGSSVAFVEIYDAVAGG